MFSAQRYMRSHYVCAVLALLPCISHRPWNTRMHHPGAMALIEVEDVMQQLAHALGKSS